MIEALLLALGLTLLLGGGHLLVQGASGLAVSLRIPPVVIGLTIVAFGTSAPELVVSAVGALSDHNGVVFGNVLGSNLANLGLVLGACALLAPLAVEGQIIRREVPLLLVSSATVLAMVLDVQLDGATAPLLSRSEGVCLLLLFLIFLYVNIVDVLANRPGDPVIAELSDYAGPGPRNNRRLDIIFVITGLVALMLGGDMTVQQATTIAQSLGVPEVIVGLTVVAVGTSLPELVTSLIAAWRKEADLAIGNLVGSCVFNLLFVLPVAAVLRPLEVPQGTGMDALAAMLLAALLLPLAISGKFVFTRRDGVLLLTVYFLYLGGRTVWT